MIKKAFSGHCVMGIGTDLVDVRRFRKIQERWKNNFLARLFLKSEQAYCETKAEPWVHYAGRFAIKEAVGKAFGTGIGNGLGWLDIEVVTDKITNAPSISFSSKARQLASSLNAEKVLVSLSHTSDYALAQAILLAK